MNEQTKHVPFYSKRWFSLTVIAVVLFIAGTAIVNAYDKLQNSLQVPAQTVPQNTYGGSPQAATPPAPPHTPVTLLSTSGQGTKSTQTFTATSDWTLHYSYNCSSFGSKGVFQVFIYTKNGGITPFAGPNELGLRGSDTDYYHIPGTYYLEVNSVCSWSVQVRG